MTLKNTQRPRKANAFSASPVQEAVGEFNDGYFVMPDTIATESIRSRPRRTPEAIYNKKQTHQERSGPKDHEFARAKSFSAPTSPSKTESSASPSKSEKSISPNGKRWAGPAFGNAPHPSSLPIPDFSNVSSPSQSNDPLVPAVPHQATSQPAPPSHTLTQFFPPSTYQQPAPYHPPAAYHSPAPVPTSQYPPAPAPFVQPHSISVPYSHPISIPISGQSQFSHSNHTVHPAAYHQAAPLHSAPYHPSAMSAPSLFQLSTDLRKLLNISDHQILVKA